MASKKEILDQLSVLGLTKKQANVYVACLELGTAQVGDVARKSQEKRTTAYAALQELVRLELVKAVKSGNKYLFTAEKPNAIIEKLENQKNQVKQLVPFLNDLHSNKGVDPKIEMFRGKQIIKLFDKMLNMQQKELLMIRSNKNKSQAIGQEFHFGANRRQKNIFAKVLLPRNTLKLKYEKNYFYNQKERLRAVRLLPADLETASDVFIFDNIICIISPDEKSGFMIESKNFSDLMKSIFNTLWQISKPTYSI
jgi:sugar-specific transcriptional regulator TrmB